MKRKVTLTITKMRRQTATAQQLRLHCPLCGREVELLNEAQAASALETTKAVLAKLNSTGQVHAFETVNGQFKFCKDSLFARGHTVKT